MGGISYLIGNKSNQILTKEIKSTGLHKVVSQGKELFDGFTNETNKLIKDLPVILFGDHTKNIKYIDFPFVIGADGTRLHKTIVINHQFFYLSLSYLSLLIRDRGYSRYYSFIKNKLIPIPPLSEQKRIVACIEELKPYIEEYDKLEKQEFNLTKEFPDRLRKSILQYAIQGKLVAQDLNDEPAEVLLERIRKEKELLIKSGKIKKDKSPSYIYKGDDNSYYTHNNKNDYNISDLIFEIPKNWTICTLSEISSIITDGTHKTPKYIDNGVPFLSVQNISSGNFDLTKLKHISEEEHLELIKRTKPEKNDILMCRIGTLGKPIINRLEFEFSIFVSLALIKLINKELVEWIKLVLSTPFITKYIDIVKVGGGTHTNKINIEDLNTFPIILPPLSEQTRILKMIEIIGNKITQTTK